jgi:RimJ/RimL family protein N-acetyltransferase/GNAT superfamily N-acetyltransferase
MGRERSSARASSKTVNVEVTRLGEATRALRLSGDARPQSLHAPRLILRPYQARDLEPFVALNTNPALRTHMGGALSEQAARALHARLLQSTQAPLLGAWALTDRANGSYLGHAFLRSCGVIEGPELGFLLCPEAREKELATEAARAVLDHAFATEGCDEVFATTELAHRPSQKVLEKSGMVLRRRCRDEQGVYLLYSRRLAPGHGAADAAAGRGPCARTERFAKPRSTSWYPGHGYDWSDTPSCRDSPFGHRLELDHPPTTETLEEWFATWRSHHAAKGVERAYLTFESAAPWTPFPLPEGITSDLLSVLDLLGPAPHRSPPKGAELRPFSSADDWARQAALTCAVANQGAVASPDFLRYARWYQDGLQERVESGQGRYWGAFGDGRLLASAGLFWSEGEARFQNVQTEAASRKQGLCSALLSAAVIDARRQGVAGPIYLAATTASEVERLYRSLGFAPRSWFITLGRAPRPWSRSRVTCLFT